MKFRTMAFWGGWGQISHRNAAESGNYGI